MKALFLDFDGVLNCEEYRKKYQLYASSPIQREKLALIKQITDATGAKIVLTSSWRAFWEPNGNYSDEAGEYIDSIFNEFGMQVYSKTPDENALYRDTEICSWLSANCDVDSFCILDDAKELF